MYLETCDLLLSERKGRVQSFQISKRDLRRLRDRSIRAQARDQSEVCGILLLDGDGRLHLVFLQNRSTSASHFEMAKADIREERLRASAANLQFIGTFHSHPVGFAGPGTGDLSFRDAGQFQLIYDVCARRARLWRIIRREGAVTARELTLTTDGE